ncbi:Endoplasmic reticulum oxidoreductin-1 [Neolecta irregularis DAH-3]|uniref:Endoplasmic reticulum oxidoreductin-1 n=1 Tax=Neolecta irregularis (strain DAH-3) TaxID=1198029 RepID=A0A1U7LJ75_NEOID|nr:Endoplasmic reticulum oxidoreductin-1 [Neolecta irregularis DAH-3]|eukprot:OLL22705.1 Endoplasmic reticulum oxidoreductin-1 [Neolecta irregularis DAH-3]
MQEEIPEIWRSHNLGKLDGPTPSQVGSLSLDDKPFGPDHVGACIIEDDFDTERDYCVPEDESDQSKGVYVSLVDNPERFTGYAGPHANKVWKAIYQENCFQNTHDSRFSSAVSHSSGGGLEAVIMGWNHRIQANSGGETARQALNDQSMCFEKRVFWRVMSGMHASITIHLCWEYLNQFSGEWGPNLECFQQRFGNNPEWIENLYFDYALEKVNQLAELVQSVPQTFNESLMFDHQTRADALQLKEDFRNQFRNVSRLMDCVGCDKCRLWGKLQVAGYGTALKVLFEFNENGVSEIGHYHLRRTELVSLVNLLARLSTSIHAVQQFSKDIQRKTGNTTMKYAFSDGKIDELQNSSNPRDPENILTENLPLGFKRAFMHFLSVKDRLVKWSEPHVEVFNQNFRREFSLLCDAVVDVLWSIVIFPRIVWQNLVYHIRSFFRWAFLGPAPSRTEL